MLCNLKNILKNCSSHKYKVQLHKRESDKWSKVLACCYAHSDITLFVILSSISKWNCLFVDSMYWSFFF